MEIIDVNIDTFDNEISSGTVLVDFNASWCGPCRMIRPILDEIAEERSSSKIISVDIDEQALLADKYNMPVSKMMVKLLEIGYLRFLDIGGKVCENQKNEILAD